MTMRCLLILLVLPVLTAQAQNTHSVLKLTPALQGLVQWSPVKPSHLYTEVFPDPGKLASYEKSAYGKVTLLDGHDIKLNNDRTIEETVTEAKLYTNATGIENGGNSGFWVDSNNQRVDIREAYVLQPDGTVVEVDPKLLQSSSDNTPNIFNDYYYVTIPFAQLKPGSITILVYKVITRHSNLPLPWSRSLYPANFGYIEHFQAHISWDNDNQKPSWKTDYEPLSCQEGPHSLVCTISKPSLPLPIEKDMSAFYDILPELVIAEPATWSALSTGMQTLTDQTMASNEKIKSLAAKLTGGLNDPEKKLSRLATFVEREIRYVGIEHGHQGLRPKSTLATLEHGFGDCKDKTMLFVDLAKHVGLDAYPVLTSTRRKSVAKLLLPTVNYFNHMVACVKLDSKVESCVDLTDPETSSGHLPYTLHGAVNLPINSLTVAPANFAFEPFTWIEKNQAENHFLSDGSIVETLIRNFSSHWAANLRRLLASKSKIDQERWLSEDYQAIMSDKVKPVIELQGLDEIDAELVIRSHAEFTKLFSPDELTSFTEFDPWLKNLVKTFKTTNIYYPYDFQGIHYRSEISYDLYQGKLINNLGPELNYATVWGTLSRYYRKNDNRVTVYTELKMPRTEVALDKLTEFNHFLNFLSQETRIWFSVQ